MEQLLGAAAGTVTDDYDSTVSAAVINGMFACTFRAVAVRTGA
jgi:hypothetical protein